MNQNSKLINYYSNCDLYFQEFYELIGKSKKYQGQNSKASTEHRPFSCELKYTGCGGNMEARIYPLISVKTGASNLHVSNKEGYWGNDLLLP